jgi:hypothetical protein
VSVFLWSPGEVEKAAGTLLLPIVDARDAKVLEGAWALRRSGRGRSVRRSGKGTSGHSGSGSGGRDGDKGKHAHGPSAHATGRLELEMSVAWRPAGRESVAEALLTSQGRLRHGALAGMGAAGVLGGVPYGGASSGGLAGVSAGLGGEQLEGWPSLDPGEALWTISERCKDTRRRAGRKAEPEVRARAVAASRLVGTLSIALVEAEKLLAKDNSWGQTKSDPFVEFYVGTP